MAHSIVGVNPSELSSSLNYVPIKTTVGTPYLVTPLMCKKQLATGKRQPHVDACKTPRLIRLSRHDRSGMNLKAEISQSTRR